MDGLDAKRLRATGGIEMSRLSFEQDLTRVRLKHAREHLDKSRLSGPVFAHERVNLAGANGEIHILDGVNATKALVDFDRAQESRRRNVGSPGPMMDGSGDTHCG
jgi:hypothetical protein